MTVAAHSVGGQKLTYRASIILSQGALYVSNGVDIASSAYREMMVNVAPVAYDHEGVTRASITLEQKGPYIVFAPGGNTYRHATLNDLLKVNPPMNAVVQIGSRVDTGVDVEADTLFTGRIVRIVDITPTTTTFECEQRELIQQRRVPINTIEPTIFDNDDRKKRIPSESSGEAIPIPLGEFVTYVPPLFSAVSKTFIQQELNICGYPPVVAPAIKIQNRSAQGNDSDRGTFSYAETVNGTGHLFIDTNQSNPNIDGFLWIDQLGAWARLAQVGDIQEDGFGNYLARWPGATPLSYVVNVGNQPYFRVGILCTKFIESESTGTITNAERAIDRKIENYAEINAAEIAVYEVGMGTGVGRISANYNDLGGVANQDWEGVDRPTGIRAFALLCFPTGSTLPTTGSVTIAVTFPGAPTIELFSLEEVYAIADLTTYGMTLNGRVMMIIAMQTADSSGNIGGVEDGWIGTKWANGDFSAGGSQSEGVDIPISRPISKDSRPVRVRLTNSTNQTIYLSAIGMQVAYKADPNMDRALLRALREKAWYDRLAKEKFDKPFGGTLDW